MGDVIRLFPGAGPPAPGRPDLDGVGDRYISLLEARAAGDDIVVELLSAACADDVPALRDEIHRLQRELGGDRRG